MTALHRAERFEISQEDQKVRRPVRERLRRVAPVYVLDGRSSDQSRASIRKMRTVFEECRAEDNRLGAQPARLLPS
jgi:hypothetical protein